MLNSTPHNCFNSQTGLEPFILNSKKSHIASLCDILGFLTCMTFLNAHDKKEAIWRLLTLLFSLFHIVQYYFMCPLTSQFLPCWYMLLWIFKFKFIILSFRFITLHILIYFNNNHAWQSCTCSNTPFHVPSLHLPDTNYFKDSK